MSLSEESRNAVLKSWEPVAANSKKFGVLLFIKLFEDVPGSQDFFVDFRGKPLDELRDSAKLKAHGSTVIHSVTAMVESLGELDTLVVLLHKVTERHYPRGVRLAHYEALFKVIAEFLGQQLGDAFDELTKSSWGIVLDTMTSVIKGKLDELEKS